MTASGRDSFRLRLIVASILLSSLAACGGGSDDSPASNPPSVSATSPNFSAMKSADACAAIGSLEIDKKELFLPTAGASVTSAKLVPATGSGANAVGEYCSVKVNVHPVDPSAPPIEVSVALPTQWNKKAMHFNCGGWCGTLVQGDSTVVGMSDLPSPVARGYAGFGSDGGHKSGALDGSFGMNDEALENFAGDQLRKARDTAVYLMKVRYGQGPVRTYSSGGSGGGREAMYVADRWPELYDGVIAYYPVWAAGPSFYGWHSLGVAMAALGAWANPAKQALISRSVIAACDGLDGAVDGLVSNVKACNFDPMVLRCPNGADTGDTCLSDAQINGLKAGGVTSPLTLPYAMANGLDKTVSYNVLNAGTVPSLGSKPPGLPISFDMPFGYLLTEPLVRYWILRDASFDPLQFSFTGSGYIQQRMQYISSRMDVSPNISAFVKRGGKLIIVHGSVDPLQSADWSDEYMRRATAAMGEATVKSSIRYYRVPGFAHGAGGAFTVSADTLTALEQWVEGGVAPTGLIAKDSNTATLGRTRPLCEYTTWPKYNGSGDMNSASSFTCTP